VNEQQKISASITIGDITLSFRMGDNEIVFVSASRGYKPLQVVATKGDISAIVPHLNTPVRDLPGLSRRTRRVILSEGCEYVGDVVEHTDGKWLQVREFGRKSLIELVQALEPMAVNP
jgi:DNA-directed RNA polymerase alpha subunit